MKRVFAAVLVCVILCLGVTGSENGLAGANNGGDAAVTWIVDLRKPNGEIMRVYPSDLSTDFLVNLPPGYAFAGYNQIVVLDDDMQIDWENFENGSLLILQPMFATAFPSFRNGSVVDITPVSSSVPARIDGMEDISFFDVNSDDWFEDAIIFLAERGIMQGDEWGYAMPQANVRRADFLMLIMRAYGVELGGGGGSVGVPSNFIDVDDDDYFAPYTLIARVRGFVSGDEYGRFRPYEYINRQDMCVMLFNILRARHYLPRVVTSVTIDDPDIDAGTYLNGFVAMSHFVNSGTIQGTESGLEPKGNATRAQAAQMLYNLLRSGV